MGLAVGAGIAIARGGRPGALATAPIRLPLLLAVAAVLGIVTNRIGPGGPGATDGVLLLVLAEQASLLAVVVANSLVPGMPLLGLGAVMNALVQVANRGMPVRAEAITSLGGDPAAQVFDGTHHLATADTVLLPLVDRLPVPVLDVVVSLGDVVVVLGLVVVTDSLLRPRVR